MEHQRCYIYSPPEAEERPSKRQRVSKAGVQAQTPERLQLFRELWSEQEQRIQVNIEVGIMEEIC
jgi:origin recognition complex subunit 3